MDPSQPMPNLPMTHRVWQAGKIITISIHPLLPPTGFERGAFLKTNVYLVAPVDPNAPQDDAQDDPPFIPRHDEVVETTLGSSDRRAAPYGHYVVRGENATPENVHSRVDPKGAWGNPGPPGPVLELVYEIDLDNGFSPLRDSAVVERGIALGLLALRDVPTPPMNMPHPGSIWVQAQDG